MSTRTPKQSLDKALGLLPSCIVLTLVTSVLLTAMPGLLGDEAGLLHKVLATMTSVISLIILGIGYDIHRIRWRIVFGIPGVLFLLVNMALPTDCCYTVNVWAAGKLDISEVTLVNWLGFLMTPFGTILLICAHVVNRTRMKKSPVKKKPR